MKKIIIIGLLIIGIIFITGCIQQELREIKKEGMEEKPSEEIETQPRIIQKETPEEEKNIEKEKQISSIDFKFLRKIEVGYGGYPPMIFTNNYFYVSYESDEHVFVRVYDKDFIPTGEEHQLTDEKGGDHQIVFADNYFYLVYIGSDNYLHMKKFDFDFNEIKKVAVNEHAPDMMQEGAWDMLFYYVGGFLYIGTPVEEPLKEGEIPGNNYGLHMRKFNTNFEFQNDFYLSDIGSGFGLRMILQNETFIIISSRRFEDALGSLVIRRYDKNWDFINEKRISFPELGKFSNEHFPTGFILENRLYFISYTNPTKKGREVGDLGDITLKAFDSGWNLLGQAKVTGDIPPDKANRAHLVLVGNKLYVAYDVLEEGMPYAEGYVSKVYIKEYEIIKKEKGAEAKEVTLAEDKEKLELDEGKEEQFDYPATNKVSADFRLSYFYYLPEDSFTNGEVNGLKHWETDVRNLADETGEPIKELSATFTTNLLANNWRKEELIKTGPPAYKWSYGDIPQEGVYVAGSFRPESLIEFQDQSVLFTPGFDASRSADKTIFSGPDIQTLTITVTPREEDIEKKSDGIFMNVYTTIPGGENLVDAIITSPTSGENIEVSEDRHSLRVYEQPMKTNTPWSIDITIEVTPKPWVSKVEFMPFVSVLWNLASFNDPVSKDSCVIGDADLYSKGTTAGSSVSCVTDNVGTWTWSAEGNYIWQWLDTLSSYLVAFEHQQERLEDES